MMEEDGNLLSITHTGNKICSFRPKKSVAYLSCYWRWKETLFHRCHVVMMDLIQGKCAHMLTG